MRLHNVVIGPKKFTVDGVDTMVSIDSPEPSIEPLDNSGLSIVTVGIVCDRVVLDADNHVNAETTPIYDELMSTLGVPHDD